MQGLCYPQTNDVLLNWAFVMFCDCVYTVEFISTFGQTPTSKWTADVRKLVDLSLIWAAEFFNL